MDLVSVRVNRVGNNFGISITLSVIIVNDLFLIILIVALYEF